MLTALNFGKAAAELARANSISERDAEEYLAQIGDTPEMDDDGLAIVRDEAGAEVARVKLPGEEK